MGGRSRSPVFPNMNLICLFASLALSASPAISAVNVSPSLAEGESAHSYRERPKKAFNGDATDFPLIDTSPVPYAYRYDDSVIVPSQSGNKLVESQGWVLFMFSNFDTGYYDVVVTGADNPSYELTFTNFNSYLSEVTIAEWYNPSNYYYQGVVYWEEQRPFLCVSVYVHEVYDFDCYLVERSASFTGIAPSRFIPGAPLLDGTWDIGSSGTYLWPVSIGRSYYLDGSFWRVHGATDVWKEEDEDDEFAVGISGYVRYSVGNNVVVPSTPYLLISPTIDYPSVPNFNVTLYQDAPTQGVVTLDLPEHFMPFEIWSNTCDYVNGLVQVDSLNVALPGIVLTGFDFACNGRYYNAMQISLMYVWGNKVFDGNQVIDWPGNKTGFYCMGDVAYRLYDDSFNIVYEDSYLCMAGYTIVPDGQTTAVVPSKVNWIDDSWRHITILEDREIVTDRFRYRFDNLTDLELLQYIVGGDLRPGTSNLLGLANVYNILGVAFDGVLPLLSVDILPGISIGLLLFLPLIGLIIVLIVKVIHK